MKQAEFRCKWIRREETWDCAEGIRNRNWSAGKLPVDVEAIVEFKLKLDIEPEHNLVQQTDMEAYLRSDLTGIVVDHDHYMDEKFASRMRFSFAHELGHFFLHREFYERVAFESAEEWKEILLGLPEADYTCFEYQANEFAGRLLVPREALIHEIENAGDVLKRNNMLGSHQIRSLCRSLGNFHKDRQDIRSVIRSDRKTGGAGKTMATGHLRKKGRRDRRKTEDDYDFTEGNDERGD